MSATVKVKLRHLHVTSPKHPEVIVLGNATGQIPNPEGRLAELRQGEVLRTA